MSRIKEESVVRMMGRAKQRFDVDSIEIRSPFTGLVTGEHMIYRTDTKDILKVGVPYNHTPIQNRSANLVLSKMSELKEMKLVSGAVYHGGNIISTHAKFGNDRNGRFKVGGGTGRGHGEFVEKRLMLLNSHNCKIPLSLFATPYRNKLSYGEALTLNALPSDHPLFETNMISPKDAKNIHGDIDTGKMIAVASEIFEQSELVYSHMFNTIVSGEMIRSVLETLFPTTSVSASKLIMSQMCIEYIGSQYNNTPTNGRHNKWNLYTAICAYYQYNYETMDSGNNKELSIADGKINRYCQSALDLVWNTKDSIRNKELTNENVFSIFSKTVYKGN